MSTKFKRILFDYDGTILTHKQGQSEEIGRNLGLNELQAKVFAKQLDYFFENQNFFYINKKVTTNLYFSALAYYVPCVFEFNISLQNLDHAIFRNNIYHSIVVDGVIDTLEYLKNNGYHMSIITNGFMENQIQNMKHHGLFDYFENIYAWDDSYAKPDKRFIERALAGTDPKDNVVVGNDMISDIAMAQRVGIFTIGVNLISPPGLKVKPDVEIARFDTLMKIL